MIRTTIYVMVTILCWGCGATVSKLFFTNVGNSTIVACSCLIACFALAVLNIVNGEMKKLKSYGLKDFVTMILIGLLGICAYEYFLQIGFKHLPAQEAFIINYLWPAMIILFSKPILGEKLTLWKLIAVFCSFAGVVICSSKGDIAGLLSGSPVGVLACLGAAASYGLYVPLNKKQSYSKEIALMVTYGAAAVVACAIMLLTGEGIPKTGFEITGLFIYGILCCAVPYLLWSLAVQRGNTAILSNFMYLTPVVSLVVSHLVLGDPITVYDIIGLIFIIGGITLQTVMSRQSRETGDAA